MMSRIAVLFVVGSSALSFTACGSEDTGTTPENSPPAATSEEASATEKRIEKIEAETKEAELEAALAKKEAAQEAAKARKVAAQRAAAASAAESRSIAEESEPSGEVPDVVGMRLPEAESTLSAAGYRTQAENTDTTFGIVVRSNYTVCTQSEPHGEVVTVLAQKYGC